MNIPPKQGKSIFITDTKYRIILLFGIPLLGLFLATLFPLFSNQKYNEIAKQNELAMKQIRTALINYRNECGVLPESLINLKQKYRGCRDNGNESYLKFIPKNNLGYDFDYSTSGNKFILKCETLKNPIMMTD